MVRAGGVGHHERLLERGQRGAELLGNPGDSTGTGGPLLQGAAVGIGTGGGASGDALGPAGVLVGVEHEAPLGGPLRGPADGIVLLISGGGGELEGRGGGGDGPGSRSGGGIEHLEGPAGVARKTCGFIPRHHFISFSHLFFFDIHYNLVARGTPQPESPAFSNLKKKMY